MIKVKKIFFCVLLLSLGNCGYESVYSKKNRSIIPIQNFQTEGNKSINRKIISSLNLNDNKKINGYKLIINSNKELQIASKDSAGNISIYRTIVTVKINLMSGDKVFKQKTFSANFTYNNTKNKFSLNQYKRNIENNLIDKIIDEILIFLTV